MCRKFSIANEDFPWLTCPRVRSNWLRSGTSLIGISSWDEQKQGMYPPTINQANLGFLYIYILHITLSPLSLPLSPFSFFPSLRKLMGSLAQNSSGVHWCGRRVRFNEVPERFWIRFNRVPQRFRIRIRSGWTGFWRTFHKRFRRRLREGLVLSQVRFNRVPEKVPEKVPQKVPQKVGELWCRARSGLGWRFGRLWCRARSSSTGAKPGQIQRGSAEPGQVQQGSGEGDGEGLGGFGAEPGQVQQGSGEGSREGSGRLCCRAASGSTGSRRRFQERFRRLGRLWCRARSGSTGFRSKVRGEGLEGFGAKPGQVQRGFGEGSGEELGGFGAEPGSGATGFRRRFRRRFWECLVQSQVRFKGSGEGSRKPWRKAKSGSTGTGEGWEKIVKIKRCDCWGYHRSLLFTPLRVGWPPTPQVYFGPWEG